jgi:hypothetical protein
MGVRLHNYEWIRPTEGMEFTAKLGNWTFTVKHGSEQVAAWRSRWNDGEGNFTEKLGVSNETHSIQASKLATGTL